MTNDNRMRFTFRIPEKLFNQLKAEACERGVSLNALILEILWKWSEKEEGE